jgi:hypothetical protein
LILGKYSIGIGDRFARQAQAQLIACEQALSNGIEVTPVWNKSNREHMIIGSDPSSTRQAADAAVKAVHWKFPYYCDADHITLQTVDRFIVPCDFFTIDVADSIGQAETAADIDNFVRTNQKLLGQIQLDGVDDTFEITQQNLRQASHKYLAAVHKAGEIYRAIENVKGAGKFISEVSMDETEAAQSPVELLIILAAIADEGIPIQTIAPKFSGRFNKGIDYVGDETQFGREFALDVAAIAYAVEHFGLPDNLKLSIHSGSDKFSIYSAIHAAIKRFDTGVHLKTAGTTWLEEVIGLAEAGGDGLALAKEIYIEAFKHRDELCEPYSTVIDIDPLKLPGLAQVHDWSSEEYVAALRHCDDAAAYNSSFRQLLHVGFKVAAKMGSRYLDLLDDNEPVIAKNVTENLYARHIAPVFLGRSA